MRPADFPKIVAVLLAASVGMEVTLLAGVYAMGDGLYHGLHVALMAALVCAQLALYRRLRADADPAAPAALALAIGAASTAVGDYVNGALSGVEPVSMKLTWALFLFGIGYALYTLTLWRHAGAALAQRGGLLHRWRHAILLPILAGNVAAWFAHVQPGATGHDLLATGSFVFNATLYVMLPGFALWYVAATGASLGSIVVAIGAILIPYSDLVLFDSWLRGNPAVPSRELYAYNWIVYFGGQALFSLLPSLLAASGNDRHRVPAPLATAGRLPR